MAISLTVEQLKDINCYLKDNKKSYTIVAEEVGKYVFKKGAKRSTAIDSDTVVRLKDEAEAHDHEQCCHDDKSEFLSKCLDDLPYDD